MQLKYQTCIICFGVEEGTEVQTKSMEKPISKIISENFPNLRTDMDIQK
jgi:hypothetical protein